MANTEKKMENKKAAVEKKVVTPKAEKKTVTKKEALTEKVVTEEKKVVKNETKVTFLNITEVMKLYSENGIKCYNENAKGNYRIMGHKKGSSLNIKPTKGYYIYSTDVDFENITKAKLNCKDLVLEKETNNDQCRKNVVICSTIETLKKLLAIYSQNELNKVVTEKAVVAK